MITQAKSAPDSAAHLITAIYEGSREERREAERLLLDGSPERTDALLEVLKRENKAKTRRFVVFAVGFTAAFIGLMVLLDASLSGDGPNIGGFGYPMWMAAAGIAAYFAPTRLQKQAAKALSGSNDIRAVPPLIEALDKQDSATRNEAVRALKGLLPLLRANHEDMLTDHQLNILRDQINKGDKEFAPAALKAVQQIGDERFLSTVKAWADGKGAAKKSVILKEAAAECLPFLETRIERQKVSHTLLRAAVSESEDPSALLRAAGAHGSDAATLLQPSYLESTSDDYVSAAESEADMQDAQRLTPGA